MAIIGTQDSSGTSSYSVTDVSTGRMNQTDTLLLPANQEIVSVGVHGNSNGAAQDVELYLYNMIGGDSLNAPRRVSYTISTSGSGYQDFEDTGLSIDLSAFAGQLLSVTIGNSSPGSTFNVRRATSGTGSASIASGSPDPWDGTTGSSSVAPVAWFEVQDIAPTGPTLTGPDSTTDGTATQATGTDLDTITTFSLISGTYTVGQTIDGQTATTLDYVASSGVNDCVPGTPVAGVPLEATITAPGITPYVVQQEADDGVNPAATRDITLNAPATHDVVQTMIATANTIDDQSIFGTSWIDVEDNMQAYVPKVVDGVNFTWAADGTFTTDQDKTVNVRVAYLAPSTLQYGCIDFTVQGSTIISSGMITPMIEPMISNMIEDM